LQETGDGDLAGRPTKTRAGYGQLSKTCELSTWVWCWHRTCTVDDNRGNGNDFDEPWLMMTLRDTHSHDCVDWFKSGTEKAEFQLQSTPVSQFILSSSQTTVFQVDSNAEG